MSRNGHSGEERFKRAAPSWRPRPREHGQRENRGLLSQSRTNDEFTDGPRYQVDFGNDQTALVREWQIVKDGGTKTGEY